MNSDKGDKKRHKKTRGSRYKLTKRLSISGRNKRRLSSGSAKLYMRVRGHARININREGHREPPVKIDLIQTMKPCTGVHVVSLGLCNTLFTSSETNLDSCPRKAIFRSPKRYRVQFHSRCLAG